MSYLDLRNPERLPLRDHDVTMRDYEDLFTSSQARIPGPSRDVAPENAPPVLQEYHAKRMAALRLLESDRVIGLEGAERADIMTAERAIARYGRQVANEQHVADELVEVAEFQMRELWTPHGKEVIDVPSFALSALALAKMAQSDQDPFEQKAAARALGSFPREPEQIELVRSQSIGYRTGELAVQAILEHKLATA